MSGQQHATVPAPAGKEPVPILQEAGWAPRPVWTGGESRPHRDSIPDRPARSQSLYRLSYPAHTNILNNIFVRRTIHCSSISYTFQPQQVTITPIQHHVIIFNNFPPPPQPPPSPLSLSLSLMLQPTRAWTASLLRFPNYTPLDTQGHRHTPSRTLLSE